MIKKLQRKFVLISMVSLLAVLTVLIGAVNGVNLSRMNRQADGLLTLLSQNGGSFPKTDKGKKQPHQPDQGFRLTEETPFETRYFWVRSGGDSTSEINTGHIAAISSTEAQEYGRKALDSGKASGWQGVYKFQVTQEGTGSLVVFVDCSMQLETWLAFLLTSVLVGVVCLLGVLLLVFLLSKRAVTPMVESMEKQKQFVTDAGHEIKTPLAIISANADVLELEYGSCEWLDSIRSQSVRLNELVKNLLSLAKMDEDCVSLVFSDFCVSDAVFEAAAPLEVLAETKGKHFSLEVEPGLSLHGDEAGIRQLVSILVENAVKYTPEQGEISVCLRQKEKVRLEVSNTCIGTELNLSRIFDRFYRADSSRARETGGYGIGLSIARAIVSAHRGKIQVKKEEKKIKFTVVF